MNRVGFSLPVDYPEGGSSKSARVFTELLGPFNRALPVLLDAGVQSVELRTIRPGVNVGELPNFIRTMASEGIFVTLHGLLPVEGGCVGDESAFPLWLVADDILAFQGQCVVTVHARFARDQSRTEAELMDRTVADLRALAEETERRGGMFQYALEINKMKSRVDPSFAWENVARMVRRIDHPLAGICWDYGHSHYNHLADNLSEEPPEDFLDCVVHTHVHDLGPAHGTHWPLTEGIVPVEKFCHMLSDNGYRGDFNMELDPVRYASEIHVKERILESVRILSGITCSLSSA